MAVDRWDDPQFIAGLKAAGARVLSPPEVQAGHRLVQASWLGKDVVVDAVQGLKPYGFAAPSRSSIAVWSQSNLIVHVILNWPALLIASAVAAVAADAAAPEAVRDGSWASAWNPDSLGSTAEQLLDAGPFASEVPAAVLRESLAGRLLLDAATGMWRSDVPAAGRSSACKILAEKLLADPGLLRRAALLEQSPAPAVVRASTPPVLDAGTVPRGR